jgi:hypothetical protein
MIATFVSDWEQRLSRHGEDKTSSCGKCKLKIKLAAVSQRDGRFISNKAIVIQLWRARRPRPTVRSARGPRPGSASCHDRATALRCDRRRSDMLCRRSMACAHSGLYEPKARRSAGGRSTAVKLCRRMPSSFPRCRQTVFDREVTGIQPMHFGIGKVLEERFAALAVKKMSSCPQKTIVLGCRSRKKACHFG